ncbi:hypothetical protein J6590_095598, partial [Homalodisca vitripennis]
AGVLPPPLVTMSHYPRPDCNTGWTPHTHNKPQTRGAPPLVTTSHYPRPDCNTGGSAAPTTSHYATLSKTRL